MCRFQIGVSFGVSFGVSNAESSALDLDRSGVAWMRVGGRGGGATMPGEVRGARQILRDLLGVGDRRMPDVVGTEVPSLGG